MRRRSRRLHEVAEQTAELAAPAAERPTVRRRRGVLGWLSIALLVLPAVLTFLCVMVLLAAWRDDVAISSYTGRATAEVVSVSAGRTVIRFATPDGVVRTPPAGVLYPRGLEAGQLVRIEYDIRNPDLARVADRDVTVGLLPAMLTAVGGWLLLAPVSLWLRRRSRAHA
jgi:hypothetical protein